MFANKQRQVELLIGKYIKRDRFRWRSATSVSRQTDTDTHTHTHIHIHAHIYTYAKNKYVKTKIVILTVFYQSVTNAAFHRKSNSRWSILDYDFCERSRDVIGILKEKLPRFEADRSGLGLGRWSGPAGHYGPLTVPSQVSPQLSSDLQKASHRLPTDNLSKESVVISRCS